MRIRLPGVVSFGRSIKNYKTANNIHHIAKYRASKQFLQEGLASAIEHDKKPLVIYFIEHGAKANAVFRGKTMLQRAIDTVWQTQGGGDILYYLLNRTKATRNALKYAVEGNNKWAVKILLEYGATPGPKILSLARTRGFFTVYEMLEKKHPRTIILAKLPKCGGLRFEYYKKETLTHENIKRMDKAVRDLDVCGFSRAIEKDYKFPNRKATDFVFVFDTSGTCVAGASVRMPKKVLQTHMLYVNFLCSSKRCSGAGSHLMTYLEEFARSNGMDYIGLQSSDEATTFYPKLGMVRVAGNIRRSGNTGIATRSAFGEYGYFIKRLK